jgi:hypothetical protein
MATGLYHIKSKAIHMFSRSTVNTQVMAIHRPNFTITIRRQSRGTTTSVHNVNTLARKIINMTTRY